MSKNLNVKVSKRSTKGTEAWEGTVTLPGVAPTKLLKSKTNESLFLTRYGLATAAQRLAERYGFSEVKFQGDNLTSAQPKKKTSGTKVSA